MMPSFVRSGSKSRQLPLKEEAEGLVRTAPAQVRRAAI